MIYDSPEQKNFVLEAVRKFPCNYEQALQLANTFGQSIQDGQIVPGKQQAEAFPPGKVPQPAPPAAPNAIPVKGGGKPKKKGKKRKGTK